MRELTNTEIEAISGAGLSIDCKCYEIKGASSVHFFIGYMVEAIKGIWGSGSSGGKPDPWG